MLVASLPPSSSPPARPPHPSAPYTSRDPSVISCGAALRTISPVSCSQSIDGSHSTLLTACQDFTPQI
jgi:hypothetical protein